MRRSFSTFAVLATILAACLPAADPAQQTSELVADQPDATVVAGDPSADTEDYASWFQGITEAEVSDFEAQFDADQALHPTGLPGPPSSEEPQPPDVARTSPEVEAEPEQIGVDAGTPPIPFDAVIDAGVVDAYVDGAIDASVAVDACFAENYSGSASLTLSAQANVSVPLTFLGSFGVLREHNIYASATANVNATATLAGTITGNADSWSATISVTGAANISARVDAFQELVSRRRREWFSIGSATASGNATFSDSVTFSKSCDGVVVTTPGTPAIHVNVHIDDATFQGFFFPRLQGPLITRVRQAIAQFARNFANQRLPGLVQNAVTNVNTQYAAKKNELLNQLRALLPPGCGCTKQAVPVPVVPHN